MPAVVVGDAQRLQQILLNILNNSVKFTEEGEILLEVWAEEELRPEAATDGSALEACAEEEQPQAAVGAGGGVAGAASGSSSESQPGPSVGSAFAAAGAAAACDSGSKREAARGEGRGLILHFGVRDTGIGISAENIGRLFQSFSQVSSNGGTCLLGQRALRQRQDWRLRMLSCAAPCPKTCWSPCSNEMGPMKRVCPPSPASLPRWTPHPRGATAVAAWAWPSARSCARPWAGACGPRAVAWAPAACSDGGSGCSCPTPEHRRPPAVRAAGG